jgi:4-amino-4-deoxy-L-arabinose transferase-like glycosyltransferase
VTRAGVLLLGLLGAGAVAAATSPWGVGVSPDSVAYLNAADNLAHGHGLVLTFQMPSLQPVTHGRLPFPLVHYGVFYPIALSPLIAAGLGVDNAARLLAIVLMGVNVVLVSRLAYRLTRSQIAAVAAALALVVSPVVLTAHLFALSEPLFVLLVYAGFLLLQPYLETQSVAMLLACGLVCGLAFATRWAGAALIATVVLAILVPRRRPPLRRLAHSGLFLAVALAPALAWTVRNRASGGSSPDLVWHPVTLADFRRGARDAAGFLLPPEVPIPVRGLVLVLVVVVLLECLRRFRGRMEQWNPLALTLALYVVTHVLLLIVVISLFDRAVHLEERQLVPVFPALLLLAVWALLPVLDTQRTRLVRVALVGGLVLLAGSYGYGWATRFRDFRRDGTDYTGRAWQAAASGLVALPGGPVFAAAPDAVYALTGRVVESLPVWRSPITGKRNPDYPRELTRIRSAVANRHGTLVFFSNDLLSSRGYLLGEGDAVRQFRLRRIRSSAGVFVYSR